MIVVEPLPIAAVAAPGTGAANLRTPAPKEAWFAAGVGAAAIDIDMGGAVTIDSVFLGHSNASAGASWSIATATSMGGGLVTVHAAAPMRVADAAGPRFNSFARLAAPVTSRYFRIAATQTGAAPLFAGSLVLGRAFEGPHEYGGGRVPIDTSIVEPLSDGGFGIGSGAIKTGLRWTFVLDDAQIRAFWALARRRGESRPLVVVEPEWWAHGADGAHYGLIRRFEPYTREAASDTKWALSMEEWL